MSRRLSQPQRVLQHLLAAGEEGTTGLEWAQSPPDGGPWVTDLAGVVHKLKAKGVPVQARPVKTSGGATVHAYFLADDALIPPGIVPAPRTDLEIARAVDRAVRAAEREGRQ